MSEPDRIIAARWIVPVQPAGQVLEHHCVVLRAGRIAEVLPSEDALRRYPAIARVQLEHHALIPGLVNLHTHAAMSLMRGLADDLPLMDWLKLHIWPAEAKHVSPAFVYDGTLLACAEMLRGGVTCFADMYLFPEEAARAALDAGMRAAIGIICIDFPTAYAADAQDYLRKGLQMRDQWRGQPLLSFCFAPHAPYTVSDASFTQISTYADELELPVMVHLHETRDEIEQSLKQHGKRPLRRLYDLGLLASNLIAVHAVHLDEEDIALLARYGCSVAHCPASNLKLASGFAPIARLLAAGVNVGLGTDGAASNNRLDMFEEMRLAALLAKGVSGQATAIPAATALRMATLDGARALGLEREIGSIEAGKAADLCAVDLGEIELAPCYDVISHLVYAASREHVSHVWVGGELKLDARRLQGVDKDMIIAKAQHWRQKIGTQ